MAKPKMPPAALIIAAAKKPADEKSETSGKEVAARRVFDAAKKDNFDGFYKALSAFVEICVAEYEE